jgi:hypothetical protein
MSGYRVLTSLECITVMTVVLTVTSDLDPHWNSWYWIGFGMEGYKSW